MGSRMRRLPSAVPLMVSVVVVAGLTSCSGGEDKKDTSETTARDFLSAWQSGDLTKAASFTDNPATAKQALDTTSKQLGIAKAEYKADSYTKGKDNAPATLTYNATLTLKGVADPVKIASTVPIVTANGKTTVHWTQTIVHPQLADSGKIKRDRTLPKRGEILDRSGKSLATTTPVVALSLWPAKITNADALYAALSDPMFDLDIPKLKGRVAAADPNQSLPLVTLRKEKWDGGGQVKLAGLGGIQVKEGATQSGDVAKQIVGTVASGDNADLLKNADPSASSADQVGASGLQYRYEKKLAGVADLKITVVDAGGAEKATLVDVKGKPAESLKTTLDPGVQDQAEKALKSVTGGNNASIVVLDAKSGGILAAANTPSNGDNRAFTGRYPPGSTFKTVSSGALLQAGIKPTDKVPCDNTLVVNGQTFKNYDGLKPMPEALFQDDFAQSCNTAFIGNRAKIQNDTLNKLAGDQFGIGAKWDVGTVTFDGSVPPANGENDKAASMIGQGRVLASPLVMASVAATIASGKFNQPVLAPDDVPGRVPSHPLDPSIAGQLKALMQGVVANGSGKMLQGIPGTVGAKTGTAEFDEKGETLTHGWMIAFKDDVAVAVLVEKGKSGGSAAGPVVKAFFG
ncbi:penicillin-binding transpeptidase domain-containing protein [Embleya hyalina]|uniref:Penicillin-binding protein n=1 Tax=Embleya hyalina TaxID=516124 RepID=A0A401YW50_9ACTN|nr:penicillin-binding transpeptidase domain-containing protein [Embleya hyalina]GCD98837.1 penicillin-binding protein [Embleya hyalina]